MAILYEQQSKSWDAGWSLTAVLHTNEWFAEVFTPSVSHTINKINICFQNNGTPPGNIIVSLRNASGGVPIGSDLASVTIACSSLPGGFGGPFPDWTSFNITETNVLIGQQYAIVIRVTADHSGNNYVNFVKKSAAVGGSGETDSTDSGVNWTPVAYGMSHQNYGNPTLVNYKILELAFNQSIFTEAPTWTPVSTDLMKANVKRGRMHELDKVEAGTALFTLNNSSGDWWRDNTAGTFYVTAGTECVKPLTLIRYSVTYAGTTYRRFYGVVESFLHGWLGEKGYVPIVEISCVDIFKSLNRVKLLALTSTTGAHTNVGVMTNAGTSGDAGQKIITLNNVEDINRLYAGQYLTVGDDAATEVNYISSIDYNTLTLTMFTNLANNYTTAAHGYVKKFPGGQNTAVRVNDVLSEFGWPASLRTIANGDVLITELVPPAGGTSALEHLQDVAESEGGVFFIARDGKATFQNRDYRQTLTPSATFSDDGSDSKYHLPEPIDDDEMIYNEARVDGDGITEQVVKDATSQAIQGTRVISRTESLIYDDNDAFDQAYILVQRFNSSFLRCRSLEIYPDADPTVLYPQVLAYDISTRINLELNSTENPAMIDRDYHIEGIEDNWERDGDRYEITWQLWDTNQYRIIRAVHDGHIYGENAVYAVTHDLAVGTPQNDLGVVTVGQQNMGVGIADDFWIFRGFLQFDTTGIDKTKVVGAKILVKIDGYFVIDNQFYVIVVDPSTLTHDLVATDYAVLHGSTSVWGTSTLITLPDLNTSYLVISLTQDAVDTINIAGTTQFGLRSNRDINATSPGTPGLIYELITFYGVGTSAVPRLILTMNQT